MMKSNSFFLHLVFFIIFLFFSLSSAHNKNHNSSSAASSASASASFQGSFKGCFSQVFAFGGSDTDTGNAQFMGARTPSAGSTNSPYGSNRFSNGNLVVDYLCDALALPPLPPYKNTSSTFNHGVNFAVAGSTSLSGNFISLLRSSLFKIWKDSPMSFHTQIEWFKKFLLEKQCQGKDESSCNAQLADSLFWIGDMGVSDYSGTLHSSLSPQMLTQMSVGQVSMFVRAVLESGAKYIVVQGLPPVGCLPLDVSQCPLHDRDKMGCAGIVNSAIMIHNQILQRKLEKFRRLFPNCSIVYADYWNAYLEIMKNPTKYQFKEPFKACCGAGAGDFNFNSQRPCGSAGASTCKDPSAHISWDGIHLTEAMHMHITDLFLNQGYCQPSFAELIKKKTGK